MENIRNNIKNCLEKSIMVEIGDIWCNNISANVQRYLVDTIRADIWVKINDDVYHTIESNL